MQIRCSHELAEDVLEDTAVLEESDFGVSVKSARGREALAAAGGHSNVLADVKVTALHVNGEGFGTVKSVSVSALAILELEGQDSHTDEVASVDTLVGFGDDSVHTLKERTLGGPIAGGSRSVLLTGQDNELFASITVLFGGIEHGHFLTGGNVNGGGTDLRNHLVDKTDVGESTTGHDLIVTSAGTVGVEVLGGNTALSKVASGRRVLSNLTGGTDVIRGNGVTNIKEARSISNVRDWGQTSLGRGEEGRVVDVGGGIVPFVELSGRSVELLPHL